MSALKYEKGFLEEWGLVVGIVGIALIGLIYNILAAPQLKSPTARIGFDDIGDIASDAIPSETVEPTNNWGIEIPKFELPNFQLPQYPVETEQPIETIEPVEVQPPVQPVEPVQQYEPPQQVYNPPQQQYYYDPCYPYGYGYDPPYPPYPGYQY